MTKQDKVFMQRAIELAQEGMDKNAGGPFGCVVVKDGHIIAEAHNMVTSTNDPTAHAEVTAIRKACKHLNDFQLNDCIIYTSCEPCPMCLGAIYWARPQKVFFACNKKDASQVGFDDHLIYEEIEKDYSSRTIPFQQILQEEGNSVFKNWSHKRDKTAY